MGLRDRFPTICSALGGEKFQQLAHVPPPSHTTPNPSSSTIFTYKFTSQAGTATVTDAAATPNRSATNLIFYGPPGTGKTYRTALEAVRLCLGDQVAVDFQGSEKREALMDEYRRLSSEGRIEFVTFHQSMSYEEFVEGLRPSTGDDPGEGPDEVEISSGFCLKTYDGVFKRVSERARLDQGGGNTSARLDRSARVFKVALGRRQIEDDRIRFGLDHGLIHVGWGGDIDWSDERFDDYNEIFSEWRAQKDPEATGHDGNIVITFSFRADMQVGDYIVVSDGRDRFQAFGRVTSEYFYDPDAAFHPHRRHVEWLWRDDNGTERDRFYPNSFRRHSVYKLDQSLVDWDALEAIVFGAERPRASQSARDHVLIIDEINRANISKVFGELITLLEPDKRLGMQNEIRLLLPYSKKPFGIPANLHIIGTMNTADRSIALLDTALRRRFTFRELMPDSMVLSKNVGGIDLQKLLTSINDRIEYLFDRDHQIGHAYFTNCTTRDDVEEVMRHKVIPLLAEYFYEDWSKVAAVLGDTGQGPGRFLEARRLAAPAGIEEDNFAGEKLRWRVKDQFTFSEFEA
ncbi:5-methylcytosine-specific restriction protein B [Paraburkholderia unamae]|nr:5-methylcytosine-specific restriction protein B [Paraburkholderia unamae]